MQLEAFKNQSYPWGAKYGLFSLGYFFLYSFVSNVVAFLSRHWRCWFYWWSVCLLMSWLGVSIPYHFHCFLYVYVKCRQFLLLSFPRRFAFLSIFPAFLCLLLFLSFPAPSFISYRFSISLHSFPFSFFFFSYFLFPIILYGLLRMLFSLFLLFPCFFHCFLRSFFQLVDLFFVYLLPIFYFWFFLMQDFSFSFFLSIFLLLSILLLFQFH